MHASVRAGKKITGNRNDPMTPVLVIVQCTAHQTQCQIFPGANSHEILRALGCDTCL